MLSSFGNLLIILTISASIYIIYLSSISLKDSNRYLPKKIFYMSMYQATFAIICFVTLITGFVLSDFSLITVFQNSHSAKPLFYKISGSWGNHEGSLLLWINI